MGLLVAMSLALLLMPLPAQAVEQKGRPFSRLQATTGNVAGSAAAETEETVAGAAAAAATITTNAATTLATKIGAGAGTGTLAGARARKGACWFRFCWIFPSGGSIYLMGCID